KRLEQLAHQIAAGVVEAGDVAGVPHHVRTLVRIAALDLPRHRAHGRHRLRRQAGTASSANATMLGKVASGCASTSMEAPPPRPWRRSIQTDVMPSALAGT